MRVSDLFENSLIRYGDYDYDSIIKHGRPIDATLNFEEDGNVISTGIFDNDYAFERLLKLTNRPMYHGSCYGFENFNTPLEKFRGIHFTTSAQDAAHYAQIRADKLGGVPFVYLAKLSYRNPLFTDISNDYREALQYARKNGFDAIIGPNVEAETFTDINVTDASIDANYHFEARTRLINIGCVTKKLLRVLTKKPRR